MELEEKLWKELFDLVDWIKEKIFYVEREADEFVITFSTEDDPHFKACLKEWCPVDGTGFWAFPHMLWDDDYYVEPKNDDVEKIADKYGSIYVHNDVNHFNLDDILMYAMAILNGEEK